MGTRALKDTEWKKTQDPFWGSQSVTRARLGWLPSFQR